MFGDRFCFWKSHIAATLIMLCCLIFSVTSAKAQTTSFTYQGRLTDGGNAANGNYDLQFALFDGRGLPIGSTLTRPGTSVSNGVFSVQLDFGVSAFPGADRFLEISVRPSAGGSFTTLSPRQQISATPYAIRTLSAATADTATNATQLGGVAASQYVQTNDTRLSDSRSPTAGSTNYIQNNPAAQQTASFNINGSGTAGGTLNGNVVNATTQFNINGNRMLSALGTNNLFAGAGAGQANTTGSGNTFAGTGAGQANTTGTNNSYFGFNAGQNMTTSIIGLPRSNNAFFGANAGKSLQGSNNALFGSGAGGNGTQGSNNSFFGANAGLNNATDNNSFFGSGAGQANTSGNSNAFFGVAAGNVNTTASFNSFFGNGAGQANTGANNSFFGSNAGASNTADGNAFFGFRAGAANLTAPGNSFFGAQAGEANDFGGFNTFVGAQAGAKTVGGGGEAGSFNSFFGYQAGLNNKLGKYNNFFGWQAGLGDPNSGGTGLSNNAFGALAGANLTTAFANSIFGDHAGVNLTVGSFNTFIGAYAGNPSLNGQVSNSTAIGYNATVGCDRCMVLGDAGDTALLVGIGTTTPLFKLDVRANGVGVYSESNTASGVFGVSQSSIGVKGDGYFGVYGVGENLTNNTGFPFSYTGVVGQSSAGIGVVAVSDSGNLMAGVSGNGVDHPYVQRFHINNVGTYFTGSDFAEALPARGGKAAFAPGDVLILSSNIAGAVEKSSRPYDTRAAGVYSTRPGVVGADKQGETRIDPDDLPVAIIGVVPTKVSAENGPIQIGDLLTTSATPGYAMRCNDPLKCLGAIVGKAMEPLREGKQMIKVLVGLK